MSQPDVCRKFVMICCLLLLCNSDRATAQLLPINYGLFQQIGNEEDIPDNVVTRLMQDKQGYLWIATPAGLIRFDGYRFRQHLHDEQDPHSIAGNFIFDLIQRADGSIWLLTSPGGVVIYRPDTEQFSVLQLADPQQQSLLQHARTLIEDSNGGLWLGSRQGLALLAKDQQSVEFFSSQPPHPPISQVRALLAIEQGVLIGGSEGLFYYQHEQQIVGYLPLPWLNSEASKQILSLSQSTDGVIWIGTASQGLYRLELNTGHMQHIASERQGLQSESSIFSLLQVSENELWLARFDGIARLQLSNQQWLGHFSADITDRFSLAHNDVRTLLKDQAGQLWVGGYGGGVQRFNGQPAIRLLRTSPKNSPFALASANISSILERSNGEIWLGSRGDGIEVLDRQIGVIQRILPSPDEPGQLQHGWITSMAEHSDGSLWLGVNPAQLYRQAPASKDFQLISTEQGFWQANVRRIFSDSQQRLWLGTSSGVGLWQQDTGQFSRVYDARQQVFTDYINAFAEDQQQQLWLASGDNGLFRLNAATLQVEQPLLSATSVAMPASILGLLYDAQQRLWLDTTTGLFVIDDSSADALTIRPASISNANNRSQISNHSVGANLLQDSKGRIWSQRYVYDPAFTELYPLTLADGVFYGTNWYRSFSKTRDGLMLFGGSDAVLLIDPSQFRPWQYQPAVRASAILIDGQTQHANATAIRLPADARGFSVEFAGLDLSAPNRLHYRYQLQGFDPDWRYTDASQRQASYTNLWPGHYQLIIESTNRNQLWSPHRYQLSVTVLPAFWQTPWFIVLLIMLLLLLMASIIKLRTRMLRNQALQLAFEVEARTDELKTVQKIWWKKKKWRHWARSWQA